MNLSPSSARSSRGILDRSLPPSLFAFICLCPARSLGWNVLVAGLPLKTTPAEQFWGSLSRSGVLSTGIMGTGEAADAAGSGEWGSDAC